MCVSRKFLFVLVLVWIPATALGANILFMHSYASYSHRVSMSPLANALAEGGHSITYIAPMAAKVPNPKILDIVPKSFKAFMDVSVNQEFNVNLRIQNTNPVYYTMFDKVGAMACEALLQSQEFKAWISSKPKIDLVIADIVPDCGVGIAHKLKARTILFETLPFLGILQEMFGLPDESLVTYADFVYKNPMSFWDKVKNTFTPLGWLYYGSLNLPYLESVLKEGLQIDNLPSIYDLYQNISLVLLTGNYITEQPRSLPPMFVSVPGLHIESGNKPLPQEIEAFINDEGFIYISLGTVVVASHLPDTVKDVFMQTIAAFPRIKFLWKWNGPIPTERPNNLYMANFFPQQDILSHPKILAFVTQAGRQSTQELLHFGVPTIAFPIFADQDFNAMRLTELGAAITLEIGEVTANQFRDALSQALYNETFKASVKRVSIAYKDSPMKPMEKAVWWVEYVLRHRDDDLTYLKPPARHETWFQRRKLDVWLFILGMPAMFLMLVFLTCRTCLRRVCFQGESNKKLKGQ